MEVEAGILGAYTVLEESLKAFRGCKVGRNDCFSLMAPYDNILISPHSWLESHPLISGDSAIFVSEKSVGWPPYQCHVWPDPNSLTDGTALGTDSYRHLKYR